MSDATMTANPTSASFLEDSVSSTVKSSKGFLDLPAELREQIYNLLVLKEQNTITMLSTTPGCYNSEISACQPAIAHVNHQIREEVLPLFYSSNRFLAEVPYKDDLRTAISWLLAIGDENVACLRSIVLCGWTTIPFGHMVHKRWVKVVLDLREGRLEVERDHAGNQQPPEAVARLKNGLEEVVNARKGKRWDGEGVREVMEGYYGLCTAY